MQNKLPLLGKKILVTRPKLQGEEFALQLKKQGAEPILMPAIEIKDPDSWDELDTAIDNLSNYHWLLFASSNAVISFARRLEKSQHKKLKKSMLTMPKIATIGESTAETVYQCGFLVDYFPQNYLAENFIETFPGYPGNLCDVKILWPRTNIGRQLIAEKLKEAGAQIKIVDAYKSEIPASMQEMHDKLHALISTKQLQAITIFSKQTAKNLGKIISGNFVKENDNQEKKNFSQVEGVWSSQQIIRRNLALNDRRKGPELASLEVLLQNILIVTIGPEASEGALNYLGKVNVEARKYNTKGMIDALIDYYSTKD